MLAYPRFFDSESAQCNDVSFSDPAYPEDRRIMLMNDRRRRLNDLVDRLNFQLSTLTSTVGQVIFVNWQDRIDLFRGKFCGEGVDEASDDAPNRESALFCRVGTLKDDKTKEDLDQAATENTALLWSADYTGEQASLHAARRGFTDLVPDIGRLHHPNSTTSRHKLHRRDTSTDSSDTSPSDLDVVANENLFPTPGKYWRVFHPTKDGNLHMAQAVLQAMDQDQAKQMGTDLRYEYVGAPIPLGVSFYALIQLLTSAT